jgi:P27 family predicted phage terminase small subunit
MRGRKPKVQPVKPRGRKPAAKRPRRATTPAAPAVPAPKLAEIDAKSFQQLYEQPLTTAGIITDADLPALRIMSQAYWIADKAAKQLEVEPFTRDDENKIERKSPWLQIWRDAATTFRAYASEFGMTPVARARVTPRPGKKKTLAEMLAEATPDGED